MKNDAEIKETKVKYNRKYFLLIYSFLILTMLGSCIGSPEAEYEDDQVAKKFESDQDSSVIYVYRNTVKSALQTFRIYIDSNVIGDMNNKTFFRVTIPDDHHILVMTDMKNIIYGTKQIKTEKDSIYFFEMEIDAGIYSGNPRLVAVNEIDAKTEISKCTLLRNGTTGLDD